MMQCVSCHCNSGQATAALAMRRFVKPKLAIPCHYGSFALVDQTADAFAAALAGSDITVLVPKKGESVGL